MSPLRRPDIEKCQGALCYEMNVSQIKFMIGYLLNITLMADSQAAQLQWMVSTQQWTVLALMILLVAVPLLMYGRYHRLAARRQREVNDQLARHNRELAEAKAQTEETSRMKTQLLDNAATFS